MNLSDISDASIRETIQLFERYQNRDMPPIEHLERELSDKDKLLPAPRTSHLAQLFLSVARHEQFINTILDRFYEHRRRRYHDDRLVLLLMAYVLIFQAHTAESVPRVKSLLTELDRNKAFSLLEYLKRRDTVLELAQAGCMYFDVDYVKSNILVGAVQDPSPCRALYEEFKADLTQEKAAMKKSLTTPADPMLLHHPSGRMPKPPPGTPEEEVKVQPKPVPASTYIRPSDKLLVQKRAENREAAMKLYEEAQSDCFQVAKMTKKPPFVEPEAIAIPAISSRPVPKSMRASVPIKHTTSSVMRDAARILKEEEKAAQRLEELASGASNYIAFEKMVAELRDEDEQWHLEDIEKKHLLGQLTYEEAILAKKRIVKENKEKRALFEQEREELERGLVEMRQAEEMEAKLNVEKIQKIQDSVRMKQKDVMDHKIKTAQEVADATKALLEKALRERQEELERKIELIKEIRVLEMLNRLRPAKEFDSSQTMQVGLLCEMSVAELRERLCILRVDLQEELEERQANVKELREKKKQLVCDTQQFVEMMRQCKTREVENLKEQKPRKPLLQESDELKGLRVRLEAARQLRKQLEDGE